MKILVVYCHPVETSFHATLHRDVVDTLRQAGHEVDDLDLYAEGFDPVMSRQERLGYHAVPANQAPMQPYVDRLRRAEALVFCFPIWSFGPPAMLKGFFDRLLMPGVAFDISDPAHVKPGLTHIRRVSAVVTYGQPRWTAWFLGDPPRRLITRYLKRLTGSGTRVDYLARYQMNVATREQLTRFREKVKATMLRFS